jgi:ribonuclease P protein subunit RPR2
VSPVTRVLSAAEADTAQPAPPAPGASREEHPRTPRTAPRRPTWPVTALTTAAALLLAPLTVLLHPDATWALLVFPVLALIAELSGQSIYGSSYVSLSAVPILSAVAAGRPTAALASAGVSALAGSLSRHWTAEQALFNTANYVLATAAASAVRMAAPTHPGYGVDDLVLLTGAMIVASLVYFLVDNLLVCIVVARHEGRLAGEVFRGDLAWLLPHFVVFGVFGTLLGAAWETYRFFGLLAFVLPPALVRVAQKQYLAHTVGHVAELRRLADDLAGSKAEVERANVALGEALEAVRERHLATARALARAIDARDKTTGGHIERVTALAVAMCEVVDPILAQNPQVAFGFLLHDVGKIGVPDAVLLKPGPLNQRELRVMRKHPTIGEALLTDAGFADVAREIVLTHHERWDGTGYPRGLKETEIPLCSRVFAVADSLDAMTNDRPYRLGIGLDAALAELRRNAGSQFDPLAVEALLTIPHERIEELLQLGREADRALADLLG